MNNLKSIRTSIIDRGIFIGTPAIKFLFENHYKGDTEICLNSGVREYLNETDTANICNLLENYNDEFFCFENFLFDFNFSAEIIKELKKKNNFIYLSDYISSDFLNYSDEISDLADFAEIKASLDDSSDFIVRLADSLKKCDLCISLDIFADTSVENFDLIAEKLSFANENIKIVLNPKERCFSKNLADIAGYAYVSFVRDTDTGNNDSVLVYPDNEKLLALCQCGNCYLETKVIKNMVL